MNDELKLLFIYTKLREIIQKTKNLLFFILFSIIIAKYLTDAKSSKNSYKIKSILGYLLNNNNL
jgi:hypothetical protein